MNSIKLGTTTIGIQTPNGVVLAAERRMASKLMEPESVEKIIQLDTHLAGAMSGFVADARTIIDFARVEAQNHWFVYNESIKTCSIAQAICGLAMRFGERNDNEESYMVR